MVSKIVFRLALITGIAAIAYAGVNLIQAPSSSTSVIVETAEEVEIPLDALYSRNPSNPLDAFDSTIVIDNMEAVGGWTTIDYTLPGTTYGQVADVPVGSPNSPARWCGHGRVAVACVARTIGTPAARRDRTGVW